MIRNITSIISPDGAKVVSMTRVKVLNTANALFRLSNGETIRLRHGITCMPSCEDGEIGDSADEESKDTHSRAQFSINTLTFSTSITENQNLIDVAKMGYVYDAKTSMELRASESMDRVRQGMKKNGADLKSDKVVLSPQVGIDDRGDVYFGVVVGDKSRMVGGHSYVTESLLSHKDDNVGPLRMLFSTPFIYSIDEENSVVILGFGSVLGDRAVKFATTFGQTTAILCESGDVYTVSNSHFDTEEELLAAGTPKPIFRGACDIQAAGDTVYIIDGEGMMYGISSLMKYKNNAKPVNSRILCGVKSIDTFSFGGCAVLLDNTVHAFDMDIFSYGDHHLVEDEQMVWDEEVVTLSPMPSAPVCAMRFEYYEGGPEAKHPFSSVLNVVYVLLESGEVVMWTPYSTSEYSLAP